MRLLGRAYLVLVFGFLLLPVAVLLLFSFQAGSLAVPPFRGPVLDWYARALANGRLTSGLVNSLLVGAASAAGSVLFGFLAAYGVARYRFRWRGAVRATLLAPLAVSTLAMGMGLLVLSAELGIGPSLWLVCAGHIVINLPIAFALCAAALGPRQVRLEQAARDLGAGTATVLVRITLPLIAPTLAAALALCFTLSWDEFLIAFLLTRFEVTLPVAIWGLLRGGLNPQTNAAGSLVFAASVMLVLTAQVLFFRKRR